MLVCYWLLSAQIVLESFPISSSTHVKLLEFFLLMSGCVLDRTCVLAANDHFAHGPTVLVVAAFFYPRWSFLLYNIRRCFPIIVSLSTRVIVADVITALFYLLFKCITIPTWCTGIGFVCTAAILISLKFCKNGASAQWTWPRVIVLGVVQGITLLPGFSRMALTYSAARWIKLAPRKAFEISLLIQWPLIFAAFANSLRVITTTHAWPEILHPEIALIMLVSTLLAWYGLRLVMWCINTGRLWYFSIYMIVPLSVWLSVTLHGMALPH